MRIVRAIALVISFLVAAPVRAAGDGDDAQHARPDEQARSYFVIGARHFRQGEFEEAIASFQAGYERSPQPLFLFNIAQAARKSGQVELAVESYSRYLQQEPSPTAPQRVEAEEQLARLKRQHSQPPATISPAPSPESRPSAPAPAVMPSLSSPVVAPDSRTAIAKRAAPAPRPWWARGWFWGTVTGVVVVGAGVGIGVWLGLQPRAPDRPSLGSVTF